MQYHQVSHETFFAEMGVEHIYRYIDFRSLFILSANIRILCTADKVCIELQC